MELQEIPDLSHVEAIQRCTKHLQDARILEIQRSVSNTREALTKGKRALRASVADTSSPTKKIRVDESTRRALTRKTRPLRSNVTVSEPTTSLGPTAVNTESEIKKLLYAHNGVSERRADTLLKNLRKSNKSYAATTADMARLQAGFWKVDVGKAYSERYLSLTAKEWSEIRWVDTSVAWGHREYDRAQCLKEDMKYVVSFEKFYKTHPLDICRRQNGRLWHNDEGIGHLQYNARTEKGYFSEGNHRLLFAYNKRVKAFPINVHNDGGYEDTRWKAKRASNLLLWKAIKVNGTMLTLYPAQFLFISREQ